MTDKELADFYKEKFEKADRNYREYRKELNSFLRGNYSMLPEDEDLIKKQNIHLNALVQKMKCCGNCQWYQNFGIVGCMLEQTTKYDNDNSCSEWELFEQ